MALHPPVRLVRLKPLPQINPPFAITAGCIEGLKIRRPLRLVGSIPTLGATFTGEWGGSVTRVRPSMFQWDTAPFRHPVWNLEVLTHRLANVVPFPWVKSQHNECTEGC